MVDKNGNLSSAERQKLIDAYEVGIAQQEALQVGANVITGETPGSDDKYLVGFTTVAPIGSAELKFYAYTANGLAAYEDYVLEVETRPNADNYNLETGSGSYGAKKFLTIPKGQTYGLLTITLSRVATITDTMKVNVVITSYPLYPKLPNGNSSYEFNITFEERPAAIPAIGGWTKVIDLDLKDTAIVPAGGGVVVKTGYQYWDIATATGGTPTLSVNNTKVALPADAEITGKNTSTVAKIYFERRIGSGATNWAGEYTSITDGTNTMLWTDGNNVRFNGANITNLSGLSPSTKWIGYAIDWSAKLLWWRNLEPLGNWNNNVSANPATGSGGININFPGLPTGTRTIKQKWIYNSGTIEYNFGDRRWIGTQPAGFSLWSPITYTDTVDHMTPCFNSHDFGVGQQNNNNRRFWYTHREEFQPTSPYYRMVANSNTKLANLHAIIDGVDGGEAKRSFRAIKAPGTVYDLYMGDLNLPEVSPQNQVYYNRFTATAGQTAFTITNWTPANGSDCWLFVNGVKVATWTLSGSSLTYTGAALSAGDNVIAFRPNQSGSDWLAGWAHTSTLFHSRYGYYEVRARYPSYNDYTWPLALWSTGSYGWPSEIDIAEMYNGDASDTSTGNMGLHAGTPSNRSSDSPRVRSVDATKISGLGSYSRSTWNRFGLMWTPNDLTFYINDVKLWTISTDDRLAPQYWRAENAPIGNVHSSPPADLTKYAYNVLTSLASDTYVDYIRIWQAPKIAGNESTNHFIWKNKAVTTQVSGYTWDSETAPPSFTVAGAVATASLSKSKAYLEKDGSPNGYLGNIESHVRTTGSVVSGKRYAAIQVNCTGTPVVTVGVGTAIVAMMGQSWYGMLGREVYGRLANLTSFVVDGTNVRFRNGAGGEQMPGLGANQQTLTTLPAYTVADGTIFHIAIDGTANKCWVAVDNGNWNNSGSDNPATNTGGFTLPTYMQGKALMPYAYFSNQSSADVTFTLVPGRIGSLTGFSAF